MKATMHATVIALALACTSAHGQQRADEQTEVKKQTANSAPQTVIETPTTRERERQQRLTDGLNTKRAAPDPRQKDEYGTPKPDTPPGQGTNSSTDAVRAADAKH
jgi:hypothetical protein